MLTKEKLLYIYQRAMHSLGELSLIASTLYALNVG
jgi:hypothetical protein